MNRELILEAFYNLKPVNPLILQGIADALEYLEEKAQEPCNMKMESKEKISVEKERGSELSTYSRIGISDAKYKALMIDRDNVKLFERLCEKENISKKVWFYKTMNQVVSGPLSALEMDELFKSKQLNEDCMIQGPTDSEFIPFSITVKRYLKKLHMDKSAHSIKLDKHRTPAKTAGLLIERKYRILSMEVGPTLSFLDAITEDSECCEVFQTRARSSTMGQ